MQSNKYLVMHNNELSDRSISNSVIFELAKSSAYHFIIALHEGTTTVVTFSMPEKSKYVLQIALLITLKGPSDSQNGAISVLKLGK